MILSNRHRLADTHTRCRILIEHAYFALIVTDVLARFWGEILLMPDEIGIGCHLVGIVELPPQFLAIRDAV